MATMPAVFDNSESARFLRTSDRTDTVRVGVVPRADRDYQLRSFPGEDVFFYCKKIDNSRLIRQDDPKASKACWSAIGAATAIVGLLTLAMVPSVANTVAGYRLESLRAEERKLLDERRNLDLEEARMVSPDRLAKLAEKHNLVTPKNNQVFHLNSKQDSAVAMVK